LPALEATLQLLATRYRNLAICRLWDNLGLSLARTISEDWRMAARSNLPGQFVQLKSV
jgi:hypothetical protein